LKFRSLDAAGDWRFGAGLQSYLTEEDAVATDVKTALKVFLGECFWALNAGVDWWNLLGARARAEQNIVLQCRQVISSREGVTKINRVEALLDRSTRRLTISFNVDTVFSRNLNGEVAVP
jgi:hypothetical protein